VLRGFDDTAPRDGPSLAEAHGIAVIAKLLEHAEWYSECAEDDHA
jgi:hypothetical protein